MNKWIAWFLAAITAVETLPVMAGNFSYGLEFDLIIFTMWIVSIAFLIFMPIFLLSQNMKKVPNILGSFRSSKDAGLS